MNKCNNLLFSGLWIRGTEGVCRHWGRDQPHPFPEEVLPVLPHPHCLEIWLILLTTTEIITHWVDFPNSWVLFSSSSASQRSWSTNHNWAKYSLSWYPTSLVLFSSSSTLPTVFRNLHLLTTTDYIFYWVDYPTSWALFSSRRSSSSSASPTVLSYLDEILTTTEPITSSKLIEPITKYA